MKIVKEAVPDDCFGLGLIKDYQLNQPVTMDFLTYLSEFGELCILTDMKRPFYTFDKEYFFTIKGIVGDARMKVIYRPNNMELVSDFLALLIQNYPLSGDSGMDEMRRDEQALIRRIKERDAGPI
jgi:hypothetical protein